MAEETPKKERIAKRMARAGLCSRRDAERWIEDGRVVLNGEKLTTPAVTVGDDDLIIVDGKPLPRKERPRLWRYHKPVGLVTSHSDEKGRETVFDTLPEELPRVISVGRLDINSEGLLLLTNDGQLQARITDPKHKLAKTYWAQVEGEPSEQQLKQLRDGPILNDGPTRPAEVETIAEPGLWPRNPPVRFRQNKPTSWLAITIREGRNRQVRRMTAAVGLPTLRLVRVRIGDWRLAELQPGQWRELPL